MAIRVISSGTGKIRHPGRIVGGSANIDPYWSYVVALLHLDGSNSG